MRISIGTLIISCILIGYGPTGVGQDLKLWYTSPAPEWLEGLPIGNGRLMAVVLGGIYQEKIQLNEETLWSGHLVERDHPEGAKHLDEIRQMMFEGKYHLAEQLVKEKMLGRSLEPGKDAYQTLGDLKLSFQYPDITAEISDYYRALDLETACVSISYKHGHTLYTREVFSSAADQAIVMRLTADQPNGLDFIAEFSRPHADVQFVGSNQIVLSGMASYPPEKEWTGVHYESQMIIQSNRGDIVPTSKGLHISQADTVLIKLVAATDYRRADPHQTCNSRLGEVDHQNYSSLKQAHIRDYQSLFKRVEMMLGSSKIKPSKTNLYHGKAPVASLPTDQRIEAVGQGVEDPDLIKLYFQFGRYLLISASRPGTLAINLWGKWVNSMAPSYDADYHTNINIPMNYWPAEICNLAECHRPFFDLIDALRPNGRMTAKTTYGCHGFVAHHATDHTYFTAAIGAPPHGMWPLTPAWGCHQMWDHYLFTRDRSYLEDHSYPIMREAAEFFIDYLIEDPHTGYLVSGPSTSPENRFITENEKVVSLSMGPTMDMQLIRDLFTNCIAASRELDMDEDFRGLLEEMLPRLLPMQIGADGRLLEWSKPFKEHDIGHKHISHLWGLLEGNQITPEGTPELAKAAQESLNVRVKYGTAITQVFRAMTAWVMSGYNRLWDGDEAYKHLKYAIGQSATTNLMATSYQGMNRKMWETDANFGFTSCIAEMFLQSHTDYVHLLPALPSQLDVGHVKGLRARGAFEVDVSWDQGKLIMVRIKSLAGEKCKLRYGQEKVEFNTTVGEEYRFDGTLARI